MVAQLENRPSLDHIQKTKTLISALNLISRNLPLPPEIFDAVSSIYLAEDDADDNVEDGVGGGVQKSGDNRFSEEEEEDSSVPQILDRGDLMTEFEDALVKQRTNCMLGLRLSESRESRLQSHIQHRLTELEGPICC